MRINTVEGRNEFMKMADAVNSEQENVEGISSQGLDLNTEEGRKFLNLKGLSNYLLINNSGRCPIAQ